MNRETAIRVGDEILKDKRDSTPNSKNQAPQFMSGRNGIRAFFLPVLTSAIFSVIATEYDLTPVLSVSIGTSIGLLFAAAINRETRIQAQPGIR